MEEGRGKSDAKEKSLRPEKLRLGSKRHKPRKASSQKLKGARTDCLAEAFRRN
jgi:hypothetical protein